MSSRGKKDCPNCNTEIGARCLLCSNCGYHFLLKEVRKDLLEKKNKSKKIKIFTESGQGRKICPQCYIIIGCITKICPKCNFDFSIMQKEKKIEKEEIRKEKELKRKKTKEKKESLIGFNILQKELEAAGIQQGVMESIKYVGSVKLSPKEHAERILSYGQKKASLLLRSHKLAKKWHHVDWDIVEKGINNE